MILGNLLEFGCCPAKWWFIGHLLWFGLSYWVVAHKKALHGGVYWTMAVGLALMMRLPIILYGGQINKDESQMLAQGITLMVDPVLYHLVDPTTGGPLNSYLLAVLGWLGAKIDFHLAHFLSLLLSLFSFYFIYKTIKLLRNERIAQVVVLPFLVFLSFVQDSNYVHYNSEVNAILLLSVVVYAWAYLAKTQAYTPWRLVGFGVMLALVPLCKLQGLPFAFFWGLAILFQFWLAKPSKFWQYFGWVAVGVILTWGIWVLLLAVNGVLDDFYNFYIYANSQYSHRLTGERPKFFYTLMRFPVVVVKKAIELNYIFFPILVLSLSLGVVNKTLVKERLRAILKRDYYILPLMLLYMVAISMTIVRTGSFYAHYFLFYLLPLALIFGLWLENFSKTWYWAVLSTQLIFFVVLVKDIVTDHPINLYLTKAPQAQISEVGRAILKHKKQGDHLAVWGWSCEYFVESQMPQGVAENHTTRSAMKHPLQEVYMQRYLRDMRLNRPAIFVDAITPKTLWMEKPEVYKHENYPALAQLIAANYILKDSLQGVRIYVRNR
ncbi:hypothetical protein [Runella zeae]|uniref:hypothetical protein n=1 Tax=Runella zeae TaxID=94255 RepID=UPI002354B46E|nr:hypothetical protein [Runella zeae]